MKVIIYEGVKHFRKKRVDMEEHGIVKFIKDHGFYYEGLPVDQIARQIKQKIKKSSQDSNEVKSKLEQLSLYLNNEKNKSIFEIYAIVLKNPKGVTYKDIDNKVKIGIVSVSHYCCRLKKMNFVELKHEKNQKVVYPKDGNSQKKNQEEEDEKNLKSKMCGPFHFRELPMLDNIWINVSSFQSYKSNGITNQDIKQKLNKTSETKLIMKMVDQARDIFDFDKQMVSEGKVFENRFKNVTKEIMDIQFESLDEENETQEKLNPRIESWLRAKFPQYSSQKFLFKFINSELKDYFSAGGVKSARRTCTPIKLNRYIKILNNLHYNWPQTHIELKNFIIDEERDLQNGIMHKRSILGILDGLVSKGILKKMDHERQNQKEFDEDGDKVDHANKVQTYYYPLWGPEGKEKDIREEQSSGLKMKHRRQHLASLKTQKQIGNKVGLNEYRRELKVRLMWASLEQLYLKSLKKSFKNIQLTKRAKIVIKTYQPETHILSLLEQPNPYKVPKLLAETYSDFIAQLDEFIQSEGLKQEPINVNYQVVKLFRKHGRVGEGELRGKFGNGWFERIEPMVGAGLVEADGGGGWVLVQSDRYFV